MMDYVQHTPAPTESSGRQPEEGGIAASNVHAERRRSGRDEVSNQIY